MQELITTRPVGTIGVSCNELARYSVFWHWWGLLRVPKATANIMAAGYDTACNSNDIIRQMRPEDQWVFIMDDDHTFAPDLLLNLLDRNVDVVVPLYTQRQPPFLPVAYKAELPTGQFEQFTWEDLDGRGGLLPVASAGKAGVLVRRHVLEALKDPWFEWAGLIGEDHYFFKKCRDAGFEVYVDLDNRMEHLTTFAIQPHQYEDGRWVGRVALGHDVFVDCRATVVPDPATP